MKFFTELALCWGGAIVSPAAEITISGQREEEHCPRNCSHEHATSGVRKNKPSKHWKPNLLAISEDHPISNLIQQTVRSDHNKQPREVKPKSNTKVVPPPSHPHNYWKTSHLMALSAFSPTPFMI
ncbi:uncharacterized protein LOC111368837 [Olea europaea var. sylvestris]|uniref:Uncharacterized protein n=1 Tax=Olea europaea subsp. europaea TaxID=158383 RepID=A0A8S0SEH8_OLEEU|nr:uncharacterized protein LOC111368837 [Olea europaea var. sylvestris]CAA2990123.1 Hypothetical predicted protein [Olea europaea subsp. europaea]